jgi:hypothetical protein
MAVCNFYPLFVRRNFVVCLSCVFDKLGCAAGERKFSEHWCRQRTALLEYKFGIGIGRVRMRSKITPFSSSNFTADFSWRADSIYTVVLILRSTWPSRVPLWAATALMRESRRRRSYCWVKAGMKILGLSCQITLQAKCQLKMKHQEYLVKTVTYVVRICAMFIHVYRKWKWKS